MPHNPSVLGTVTLFTFLIMLPLTLMITLLGILPKWSLTKEPQYAIAIGSVHPSAGINSSFNILT